MASGCPLGCILDVSLMLGMGWRGRQLDPPDRLEDLGRDLFALFLESPKLRQRLRLIGVWRSSRQRAESMSFNTRAPVNVKDQVQRTLFFPANTGRRPERTRSDPKERQRPPVRIGQDAACHALTSSN